MKKARGLHVCFNQSDPIILVGDERGGVNSFKLSTSLNQGPLEYEPSKEEKEKETENTVYPSTMELEQGKMEKFLDSLDKHVY
jgi:dynein intermediate chain 1